MGGLGAAAGGGAAGTAGGALLGATLGSVIPGFGNAAGAIIGGSLGGTLGAGAGLESYAQQQATNAQEKSLLNANNAPSAGTANTPLTAGQKVDSIYTSPDGVLQPAQSARQSLLGN
jgi:phage tail tape-measure protein